MNRTNIFRSAALLLSLGAFFSLSTPVSAFGVTMPPSMQLSGLTLDTPLTFSGNPQTNSTLFDEFEFGTPGPITVSDNPKSTSLPDLLVNPTPTPTPTATPVVHHRLSLVQTAYASTDKSSTDPTPVPTTTPTPQPATPPPSTGGLSADKLFSMVQSYRQQRNLPPFQIDPRACQVANERAPMVLEEIDDGHMHSGLRAMNLPYWNSENIITMRTEEGAFNWWIHDPIHLDAIVGNYKYSCLACSGFACAEEFTNFQPK